MGLQHIETMTEAVSVRYELSEWLYKHPKAYLMCFFMFVHSSAHFSLLLNVFYVASKADSCINMLNICSQSLMSKSSGKSLNLSDQFILFVFQTYFWDYKYGLFTIRTGLFSVVFLYCSLILTVINLKGAPSAKITLL